MREREPATLRSGPTLEFPVFGVASNGARAEAIGQSQNGEQWAIRLPANLAIEQQRPIRRQVHASSPAKIFGQRLRRHAEDRLGWFAGFQRFTS